MYKSANEKFDKMCETGYLKGCRKKCPQDAEDDEVGQLCGSTPPHPVRCPG